MTLHERVNVIVSTDRTGVKLKHHLFTTNVQQDAEERRTDHEIEELADGRFQDEKQKIVPQRVGDKSISLEGNLETR